MDALPTVLDIPRKVEKAQQTTITSAAAKGDDLVRAVLKYNNEKGRKAILSVAKTIHHDFGQYNQSLSVSLIQNDLDKLKEDSNVDWFEGDGKVIYCSIR